MVVVITIACWAALVIAGLLMTRWVQRSVMDPSSDEQEALEALAPRPLDEEGPIPARRPIVRGTGQVLFAEPEGRALRMDCVLIGKETEGASPGSLLTVRLCPPRVQPLTHAFEGLLERWAREVQVVDLELRPAPDGWRLCLDDGELRLNLEISEPTSVA